MGILAAGLKVIVGNYFTRIRGAIVRGARDGFQATNLSGDSSVPLHGLIGLGQDSYCFPVGDGSILPPGKLGFVRETFTNAQPGFSGFGA